MKKYLFHASLLSYCLLLLTSCRTETKEYKSAFSKEYSNKKNIEVIRADQYKQFYGIFTGINYGNAHSFLYEFTIHPDKHKWKGTLNQVPRTLLFCEEDIYLVVTEEKVKVDSLHPNDKPVVKDTIIYFHNVDERYFFKLFGDQYFVRVDSVAYKSKRGHCVEEPIPYY